MAKITRANVYPSRLRRTTGRTALRTFSVFFVLTLMVSALLIYVKPAESSTPPFSFSAVGDIGASTWGTDPQLRAIPGTGTTFSIFLGDLSYGTITPASAWCQWVKDRVGATYPVELISGNHEDNGPDGLIDNFASCLPHSLSSPITGVYGKEYYFDYPTSSPLARFILISPGLDFTNGGSYRYSSNNAHYTWVANAIDDARAKNIPWVIVGYHKTCITTGAKSCYENSDLLPLYRLLLNKKVDLILHGHDHNYQRSKQLTCVNPDSFTSSCVAGDGLSGSYSKGLGSVSVIVGTGGQGNYAVSALDSEAGYFAKINGAETTIGHLVVSVSPDRLDAQYSSVLSSTSFVPSAFTDSFSIAASTSAPTSTSTSSNTMQLSLNPTVLGAHSVPEGSGIVASRVHPNIYWMIPDSGQPATLYAVDNTGRTVKTFTVEGASNIDWEDIAIDEDNNIWIADIGDNSWTRGSYVLYRFSEPNPFGVATGVTTTAYRYVYPDGSRDSETAFVWQGIPYVVHKTSPGVAKVYRFPELNPATTVTLTAIAQFDSAGRYITGADISTDGRRLALASTSYTFGTTAIEDYHWVVERSSTSTNIADFFTSPSRVWRIGFNNVGAEAISFNVGKYDFVVANEDGALWQIAGNQYDSSLIQPASLSTFDADLRRGMAVSNIATTSSSLPAYVLDSTDPSKVLWLIHADPWAVNSATGSISTSYTGQGSVAVRNTLSNIVGSFGGYPKIQYGRNPWGQFAGDQPPSFPIQLKNMEELRAGAGYALTFNRIGGNVAYDLFLTSAADTSDNTGAIEVMVWLWRNGIVTGGNSAGSIIVPITVNGAPFQAKFNVWTGAAGGNAGTVWFLLDDAQMIQSGDVELSLLFFAKDAVQRLGKSLDLYLQGVEFGTEFTQANQDYTFTLTRFNIQQTIGSSTTTATTSTTTTSTTTTTTTSPPTILTTFDSDLRRGAATSATGTSTYSTTWSVPVLDSTDQSRILWRIDPSPWAVESSASGAVSVEYTSQGSVIVRNTLSGITGPFGGYPKIQYGRNPWGDLAVGQSPIFPIQLNQMSDLVAGTTYTLSYNRMTGNVMYDLWLTSTPDAVDNTGAIEIMIRFWQNGASQGTPDEVLTVPMKINGQQVQGKFNARVGTTFSTPGGAVFSFELDPMVQSGDVEVSLLFFAKYAVQKLGLDLNLYLQGVEFGPEFTEADQDYTFTLTRFNIQQTIGSSTTTATTSTTTTSTTTTTAATTTTTTTTAQPSISYTLAFEGYDYDNPNEVTVLLNGRAVATLPATASSVNDNEWLSVSLDITTFVVSGSNTLTFEQGNGGALLAVRNVSIISSDGTTIFADSAARMILYSGSTISKPSTTYSFTM